MQKEMRFMANGDNSPLKDLISRTGGRWNVASMRAPGFRMLSEMLEEEENRRYAQHFRAAAPLPERSQIQLDNAVVEVGLQRLTFVQDLMTEGLTYNLPDPLSVTQLAWNAVNKVANAQRSMSPEARTENFLPALLESRLPIYLTMAGFELDIRTLRESQRAGMPLDTAGIKSATRSVNEALEDAAINGASTLDGQQLTVAGYSAPGLVNAPNANTQALTLAAWVTVPVGTTITAEILAMVTKLNTDKKFGPYNLYVPTAVGVALNTDYKANGNDSILVRLEQMTFGGRNLRVRVADMLPSTKVALVQMTSDVIDLVTGQQPTVIPWTSLSGFTFHNLVMAIQIPRVRSDYNGDSGVCVGTLA